VDEELNKPDQGEIERPAYCSFIRAGKTYYIPIEYLREVVEIEEIFPVPLAPQYIKGAIPLRGEVIPVIDIATIHSPSLACQDTRILIVVDVLKESIGFLSDSLPSFVYNKEEIPEEEIIDLKNFFETYMIRESV
jgi:chemotaxis signal transduction protein